jgi:lipid-A-disaccharide synthase-like uncharacterized protein
VQAEALLAPAVAAGWLGQACFFSRFFVQWLASERARHSVVPRSFWWLSLGGAVLTSAYALVRGTPLLLFGFLVGGAIAVRNLRLAPTRAPLDVRRFVPLALIFLAGLTWSELAGGDLARADSRAWLALGVLGQVLWTARFPVQWVLSERAGRSLFPPAFWWLSLAGNVLLLAYALHLRDPVFVLGFLPGPFLQARNLALSRCSPRGA